MATIGGARVTGLAALQRDLLALGVEVSDLKDVMGNLAQEGARLAASFAPRRTGTLADSVKGNRARNAAIVKAGSVRKAPYAGAINYGWRRRHIKPSLFMQRADDAMRPRAVTDLEHALNHLIRSKGLQ